MIRVHAAGAVSLDYSQYHAGVTSTLDFRCRVRPGAHARQKLSSTQGARVRGGTHCRTMREMIHNGFPHTISEKVAAAGDTIPASQPSSE